MSDDPNKTEEIVQDPTAPPQPEDDSSTVRPTPPVEEDAKDGDVDKTSAA